MDYFTQECIDTFKNQKFQFLILKEEGNDFFITLNRPEKKNSLHPKMIEELAFAFQYAHQNPSVWNLVINANGTVFCAGADLKAMRGDLGEITSTIPKANSQILIADLFKKVYKPILVLLNADVYAGGTFFVAGATEVIANRKINIHLSEVKRGIFPFQVMASLSEVINPKKALRWCISGDAWSAQKAYDNDLIHLLVDSEAELLAEMDKWLKKNRLNSPSAIQLGLESYDNFTKEENQHKYLMGMLYKSLETKDSKEGIKAFREKRKPNWTGE